MLNFLLLTSTIFILSLILCLLPRGNVSHVSKVETIRKFYPYIKVYAAGFILAMLLLDFIPHFAGICYHDHHHEKGTTKKHKK